MRGISRLAEDVVSFSGRTLLRGVGSLVVLCLRSSFLGLWLFQFCVEKHEWKVGHHDIYTRAHCSLAYFTGLSTYVLQTQTKLWVSCTTCTVLRWERDCCFSYSVKSVTLESSAVMSNVDKGARTLCSATFWHVLVWRKHRISIWASREITQKPESKSPWIRIIKICSVVSGI